MRKLALTLIAVVIINMFTGMPAVSAPKREGSLFGIWLSSVKNLDFPSRPGLSKSELERELDDVVKVCKSAGINAVFFQVRPCADALYRSDIFPWSEVLSGTQGTAPDGGFDPLAYLIKKAHAENIEVHAWVNPYRIGKNEEGPDSVISALAQSSPAKQHPEYYAVCSDGGVYFNPAIPEVRDLIISGIEEIVTNYDVDGIHFDDYFYPYGVNDYPDAAEFEKYGGGFSDIADFRRNNVNLLVRDTQAAIHRIKPDVKFGISPFGIWDNSKDNPDGSQTRGMSSYRAIFADSRAWVQNGWVDYICPQIYWAYETSAAPFDKLVEWWSTLCRASDVELYVGHALYKLGSGEAGFDNVSQITRQLDLCRDSGVAGSVFFRYQTLKNNTLGCFDMIKSYSKTESEDSPAETAPFSQKSEKYITTQPAAVGALKITAPADGFRTTDANVSVTGTADPGLPLTVGGKPVDVTEHGYFAVYLPLESGGNTFTFENGGSKQSITVSRILPDSETKLVSSCFKPDSAYPGGDSIFYAGEQVELSIYALENFNVYARFLGKEVQLLPTGDASGGLVRYTACVKIPNITSGSIDGGITEFYAKTDSGNLSYNETGKAEIISSPMTLYTQNECYVYNDTGDGSMMDNYQLPAGAEVKATAFVNGLYRLQSGKWVNKDNVAKSAPESLPLDIDESKYTRVDMVFKTVPTFQSRVTEGGTLVVSLYGTDEEPEIISQSARVGAQIIRRGYFSDAVFSVESGSAEGFYISKTDEKTLSVWVYTNRRGGLEGKTIAIDPGHGGEDRGAPGPPGADGVCEDDLNLSVSYILAQKLKAAGANVILTREDQSTLPLAQRAGLIRSHTPDISISVHHNSVSRSSDFNKASGIVVLYSRETALSLSKLISGRITDGLSLPNNGYKAQSLNVCRDYRYPCILIECGFVCNPAEYEMLLTQEYKNKLCDNIVLSLSDYFK